MKALLTKELSQNNFRGFKNSQFLLLQCFDHLVKKHKSRQSISGMITPRQCFVWPSDFYQWCLYLKYLLQILQRKHEQVNITRGVFITCSCNPFIVRNSKSHVAPCLVTVSLRINCLWPPQKSSQQLLGQSSWGQQIINQRMQLLEQIGCVFESRNSCECHIKA